MNEETIVPGKKNTQNYSCPAKHTEIPLGFRCSLFLSRLPKHLVFSYTRGTAATSELLTVGAKLHTALAVTKNDIIPILNLIRKVAAPPAENLWYWEGIVTTIPLMQDTCWLLDLLFSQQCKCFRGLLSEQWLCDLGDMIWLDVTLELINPYDYYPSRIIIFKSKSCFVWFKEIKVSETIKDYLFTKHHLISFCSWPVQFWTESYQIFWVKMLFISQISSHIYDKMLLISTQWFSELFWFSLPFQ